MVETYPALVDSFAYSPIAPAIWRERGELSWRELGLMRASSGAMTAYHYRANGSPVDGVELGAPAAPFLFLMVLSGEVRITSGDTSVELRCYDSAVRYGPGEKTAWSFSHTAEVLILEGTEEHGSAYGTPSPGEWVVNREAEGAYVQGDGPRSYLSYRDLGTTEATNRRVHIQLVRAVTPVSGGTGWHYHSMGQIFYILRGWSELVVEDAAAFRMMPGDAMCLAPGMRHNVPGFSSDYLLLEMCVPADYDTIDAPPPEWLA